MNLCTFCGKPTKVGQELTIGDETEGKVAHYACVFGDDLPDYATDDDERT